MLMDSPFLGEAVSLLPTHLLVKPVFVYNGTSVNGVQFVFDNELQLIQWPTKGTTDTWSTYWPPRYALQRLRSMFISELERSPSSPRIVYLSRSDASARVVKGEESLIAGMKEVVPDLYVFVCSRQKMTTQRDLFFNADIIIGPHGACLANLVFAREGTSVIVFPMEPYSDNVWGYLTQALRQDYWVVPELASYYYQHYAVSPMSIHAVQETLRHVLE
eukprot:PhF_6_TR24842/c0_g2_i1/m.34267